MADKGTILVVGGAGFIGSHTTLLLAEAGYDVVIYDNFSTGHRDACFDFPIIEGTLSDRSALLAALETHNITCVIHFAALIEAGQSMVTPLTFYENNVTGTLTLLQAMQDAGVADIVFSSTAAVYGNQDTALLSEQTPTQPINPYGDSKVMAEMMLKAAAHCHGFRAIALRYFNASGADPLARTGERHTPETHLIPLVIEAALGRREEFNIFGTDYATPDGTCIRDYIHVRDLAAGHIAAVEFLLGQERGFFDGINLGTGTGHSVREVVEAVKRISGRAFVVNNHPRRHGDPEMLIADPSRAQELLGWSARSSDLDTIVRDAWNYFAQSNR